MEFKRANSLKFNCLRSYTALCIPSHTGTIYVIMTMYPIGGGQVESLMISSGRASCLKRSWAMQ